MNNPSTPMVSNGCTDPQLTPESTDTPNGCTERQLAPKSTVGLSKLQRSILAYLAEHHGRGSLPMQWFPNGNGVDAYYWELLHHVVGLPLSTERWHKPDPTKRDDPGTPRFDPKQIGRARYRSAVSAMSRAVRRLEHRGLVTVYHAVNSHWAGVSLRELP